MMGTVWLRLAPIQESIGPFTNAIVSHISFLCISNVNLPTNIPTSLTSSSAQPLCLSWPSPMSRPFSKTAPPLSKSAPTASTAPPHSCSQTFSSVCHIYVLPPPLLFPLYKTLTNNHTHITVLISLLFSIITYFLVNFRPGASAFFTYVLWLFLDLLAGESLVVLVASLLPNFVVALAITAFANGLWMSVGGFLVSPKILNPFWRYVFHYIDYVSPLRNPTSPPPKPFCPY